MIRSRVSGALLLFCALFVLSACDNPTDVGGELIESEGLEPQRITLPFSVDTVRYAPTTGTSVPGELDRSRFLAGRQAAAPPLGDTEAAGYVDFARANTPSSFVDLRVDSVQVRFVANYAYGDTTGTPTLALYDLTEDWEAGSAPADTAFAPGFVESRPITTFSASEGDTVSVALPEEWIAEHLSELQAESDSVFAERFHGFQVRGAEGSSGIIGFAASPTQMTVQYRPSAEGGTPPVARYGITRQLTTVRSSGGGARTDERALVQDGTGYGLRFTLTFPDSLSAVAVNRALMVFEVEPSLDLPDSSFVRPPLEQLDLYSETDEGISSIEGFPQLAFDENDNRFVNTFVLRVRVQALINGTSDDNRYQVRPARQVVQTRLGPRPVSVPSLNSALIRRDEGHEPRLEIIYTPTRAE